jgi:hypothetical protein
MRSFSLTRAASPSPSLQARSHAGVTVPRYETFPTESNNHGKRPSVIYKTVIYSLLNES